MQWSVVYEKAIRDDGSLLFPERLTEEFLAQARRSMGSYLFANQYQNEVIPEDEKRFKKEWIRYYDQLPSDTYRFAFIDPAIGQKDHHDYTGIIVIDASTDGSWYVRVANRYRMTPTEIVSKMFEICDQFKVQALGVEVVAYQEALLYLLSEEMRKRQKTIPVTGVKRVAISKETRILGLVPRFEWGRILLSPGLKDLEDELASFPRGMHDDLLDALASLEELVHYPVKKKDVLTKPHSPHDKNWERWVIDQMTKRQNQGEND